MGEGEPPGFSEFLSSNQEPGGGEGEYITWGKIDPRGEFSPAVYESVCLDLCGYICCLHAQHVVM